MAGILVYALHYEGAFNTNSLGAVSEGALVRGRGHHYRPTLPVRLMSTSSISSSVDIVRAEAW